MRNPRTIRRDDNFAMAHPQHKIHESYDAKQYVKDQGRSRKHVAQNYKRKADEQLAVATKVKTLQDETFVAKKLKVAAEVEALKGRRVVKAVTNLTITGPRVAATPQMQRPLQDEPPVCFILECDTITQGAILARQEINAMKNGKGSERWGPIRNTGEDDDKNKSHNVDSGR